MASDGRREIGRLGPADHPLVVGVEDDGVTIGTPVSWWHLDAEHREQFQRLFMQAERQAEAHLEPAVVEAEIWCGLDGCVNGPGEHLWRVTCQNREEAAGHA